MKRFEHYVNIAGLLLFAVSLLVLFGTADGRLAAAGVFAMVAILAGTLWLTCR